MIKRCAYLGCLLLGAVLLTEFILYAQNILIKNENWMSEKRMMRMVLGGGESFLLSRSTLANNILHLNGWYGAQGVVYKTAMEAEEIDVRFFLEHEGRLDITWEKNEKLEKGIRIGEDRLNPPAFFVRTIEGKILELQVLPQFVLPDAWHELRLLFTRGELNAFIDELLWFKIPYHQTGSGFLGLRAETIGPRIDIDKWSARDVQGNRYEETFRNTNQYAYLFLLNATILFALGLSLPSAGRPFLISVLVSVGLVFIFDYMYWSKLEVDIFSHAMGQIAPSDAGSGNLNSREYPIRAFWHRLSEAWCQLVGGEKVTPKLVIFHSNSAGKKRIWKGPVFYPTSEGCSLLDDGQMQALITGKKAPSVFRILFLGTSQTIGAGASAPDKTFACQTAHLLQERMTVTHQVQMLNIAVSGAVPTEQFVSYKNRYVNFAPDLVVINFSVNGEEQEFRDALFGLLRYNMDRKIKTILLQEPEDTEIASQSIYHLSHLAGRHLLLAKVGKEFDVEVLPLHHYLSGDEVKKSGLLWWDHVHLTSYGQRLVAEWLSEQIVQVFKKRKWKYF